jgi:hypothetical protein
MRWFLLGSKMGWRAWRRRAAPPAARRLLALEGLEDRQLLSFTPLAVPPLPVPQGLYAAAPANTPGGSYPTPPAYTLLVHVHLLVPGGWSAAAGGAAAQAKAAPAASTALQFDVLVSLDEAAAAPASTASPFQLQLLPLAASAGSAAPAAAPTAAPAAAAGPNLTFVFAGQAAMGPAAPPPVAPPAAAVPPVAPPAVVPPVAAAADPAAAAPANAVAPGLPPPTPPVNPPATSVPPAPAPPAGPAAPAGPASAAAQAPAPAAAAELTVNMVYTASLARAAAPASAAAPGTWTMTLEQDSAANPAAPVRVWLSASAPAVVPPVWAPTLAEPAVSEPAPPVLSMAFAVDVHHGPPLSGLALEEVLAAAAALVGADTVLGRPVAAAFVSPAHASAALAPAEGVQQLIPLSLINFTILIGEPDIGSSADAAAVLPAPGGSGMPSAGAGQANAGPATPTPTGPADSASSAGAGLPGGAASAGLALSRPAPARPGPAGPGPGDILAEAAATRLPADHSDEGRAPVVVEEPTRGATTLVVPAAAALLGPADAGVRRPTAGVAGSFAVGPSGAEAPLTQLATPFGADVLPLAAAGATRAAAAGPTPGAGRAEEDSAPRFLHLGGLLLQALLQRQGALGGEARAEAGPALIPGVQGQLPISELVKEAREALSELVRGFYRWLLGRTPADGEEQGWVNALLAGQTQEQVLGALLSTAEFYGRAAELQDGGSGDERFVQRLHLVLLQRPATPAELSAWLEALPGLDRSGVASCLLATTEFRALQVGEYYQELFGRLANPAEAAQWAATPFDLLSIRSLLQARPDLFGAATAGTVGG